MSNRKRKSQGTSQPSISKFFKTTIKKPNKEPLINVDEGVNNNNLSTNQDKNNKSNNQVSITLSEDKNGSGRNTENDVSLEKRVSQSIRQSINKLRYYDFNDRTNITTSTVTVSSPKKTKNGSTKISKVISELSLEHSKKTQMKPTYTPLEQQFNTIKSKHPDILLFVECGYKYRFFGEDAEIASKELNIYCHLDHNFMTASIPVHRLKVHLSRLIEKGYKVGVVNQTETAALKAAGDNKNAPFTRELKHVYTKATFIDREDDDNSLHTGHYVAALNKQKVDGELITAILLVNPATGDVVYETYKKNALFTGLETIFYVLKPCEIIMQKDSAKDDTYKFIENYKKLSKEQVRVEYFADSAIQTIPYETLSKDLLKHHSKFHIKAAQDCVTLLSLYLREFDLENILSCSQNYRSFSSKSCMKLNSSTIKNLELFENSVDNQVKGSLFWVIDHTASIFGKRMLKCWLTEPLLNAKEVQARLEGVSELKDNLQLTSIASIKRELHWTVDLEKGLTSIYYKKVTPKAFLKTVSMLHKLSNLLVKYGNEVKNNFQSEMILEIFSSVPNLLGSQLSDVLNALDDKAACDNSKKRLFKDPSQFPVLQECHSNIKRIENDLEEHLRKFIRPTLKNWSMLYKTVSNMEYLVEVKNSNVKVIPKDWFKVSATKQVTRYRTPVSDKKYKELCQAREELDITANIVWLEFLDNFLLTYQNCRLAVERIATLDCLISLSIVSNQPGYCKPVFEMEQSRLEVVNGRNAILDILNENNQYVANDTYLSSEQKVMLISGPNMGGKSSYIRQIALICVLAQIGSFVPAEEARLPVLDGVYTRMGGSDDITRGKSTFLVELEEASTIMKEATNNSLVILDELGRGTSTHDGTAIAYASLKFFIEDVKPYLLFVTHYPLLSELEGLTKSYVKNYHMAFMENETSQDRENDVVESIIFLYKLTCGATKKSYGLNVARLAGIRSEILQKASSKSQEMEKSIENKIKSRFRDPWFNISSLPGAAYPPHKPNEKLNPGPVSTDF